MPDRLVTDKQQAGMAQALTTFLENHPVVFCSQVVPHLHLLSLRSAATTS